MIAGSIEQLISPDMMLPDLIRAYPQARAVLDRYGLHGCGGRHGPVESIRFFSRAHGVDEAQLMAELEQVVAESPVAHRPSAVPGSAEPRADAIPSHGTSEPHFQPELADTIYRRYFTAGILLILTAGATWGAWLLWKIGFTGTFTGISIHDVNAHGHAQIFGWVGLFIMGFAYQAFPRIWHTRLAAPRLAAATFAAMVTGLVVCTVSMTLAGRWDHAAEAALLGGLVTLAAVAVFVAQILVTFRRSGAKLEPYVGFVVMALFWFLAMTVMSTWHTWNTMTAASREQLLWYIAVYQAPLRDLQIHGLALFMILGVCIRMLPGLFDAPKIGDRRAWGALVLLTLGVLGAVALFIAYGWTGNHRLAAGLMIPWGLLAAGIAMVALPWKLWRPLNTTDRSAKFIRAAYGWLAISMIMLLLLPVYQAISGIAFSHAYYGAIRHAITVGFISLMIMGFAAKVVPTLNGVDPRRLSALWGPFILVNVGCFLRVSTQTLTDWHAGFFHVVGISGTLEVAGLAWWGLGLIAIIVHGRREERETSAAVWQPRDPRPQRVLPEHRVADVLAWFPQTQEVFDRHGFSLLRNPLLRRTVARRTTLAQAAGCRGVSLDQLLRDINLAISLTVLKPAPRRGQRPEAQTCTHEPGAIPSERPALR